MSVGPAGATPTLAQIVESVRNLAARPSAGADEASLRKDAAAASRRGFRAALSTRPFTLIAELKRASPSAGALRPELDPVQVARGYERAGAAALSVVTCEPWFRGSLADLRAARAAGSLPVLCKDFLVTPRQVLEAAAAGADAVLLIAAALDPAALRELAALARSLALEIVFEAHDEREIDSVLGAGAGIVGVNSRDLRTMRVDAARALALGARLPRDVHGVFESGVRSGADLRAARDAGFRSALVGEALLRAPDPGAGLALLLAEAALR